MGQTWVIYLASYVGKALPYIYGFAAATALWWLL